MNSSTKKVRLYAGFFVDYGEVHRRSNGREIFWSNTNPVPEEQNIGSKDSTVLKECLRHFGTLQYQLLPIFCAFAVVGVHTNHYKLKTLSFR